MAHAPIRTHLCFFTTGSSISTMFLSNLPSDNLRARAIAWKSFGGLVNFSAGLHLIDQLGKGSEKCSVCKPYAYSRALRLFPCMTLYVWSGLLRRHQRTKSHGQKWKLVCGVLETSVGPKRLHLDKGVILAERWKGGLRNRSGARHQGAPNYPHPLWDYEVGSIKIARPVFLNLHIKSNQPLAKNNSKLEPQRSNNDQPLMALVGIIGLIILHMISMHRHA